MNYKSSIAHTLHQFDTENQQAEEFIEQNKLPEAARILVDIVGKDATNYRAFNNIGIIAWMRKAWNDAFTMFEKSVSLKPDYIDAQINLFDASLKLRCVNKIIPFLKEGLRTAPENEELKAILDSIEHEADQIYLSERALSIGSYNPLLEQAQKLLEEGLLNSAMEKYLLLHDLQGPHSEIYCGLGIISYYQKRYTDAYTLFLESLKINPLDCDTFLNFLDAAKECNRVDEARSIFLVYYKEFPVLDKIKKEFDLTN